jgi:hypothetical protein
MPAISVFRMLSQEDHEFEDNLGYRKTLLKGKEKGKAKQK